MCPWITFFTLPSPTLPKKRKPDYQAQGNLFAKLMKKFGHQVEVKTNPKHLGNDIFTNSTCTEDKERIDISAKRIWGSCFERSIYDVNIFIPYVPTNKIYDTRDAYLLQKGIKRLRYQDRIVSIEHGSISPLFCATTGGASPLRQKLIRKKQKSNK